MFSAIIGFLGSALAGSIVGFIGNIITSFVNLQHQKIKNQHEIRMRELDMEYVKVYTDSAVRTMDVGGKNMVDAIEASAYEKSIVLANQQDFSDRWIDKMFSIEGWIRFITIPIGLVLAIIFAFLDVIKALMRPGLTLYLVLASTFISIVCYDIIEQVGVPAIGIEKALNLFILIIDTTLFLTVSCVTWWFADRRTAKFLARLQDGNMKPGASPLSFEPGSIPGLKPKGPFVGPKNDPKND